MNHLRQIAFILTFLFGVIASGYADDIIFVDDTWADGERFSSGPDGSGIDSPWYTTTNTSLGVISGHMYATNNGSSLTFLTYFAPDSAPVTLSGAGDTLKITWTFTPITVSPSNTSQAFNFAVVDTPTFVVQSADNFSITNAQYWGYAMFCNMGVLLNHSTPYGLRKWGGTSNDFLVHQGNWSALANGATRYNHGYDSGTSYTMVWTITRGAAGEEIITNTMTGGNLNSQGYAKAYYTNTSPDTYTFDTFCVRPSNSNNTAVVFDNTHFKVEFIPGAAPAGIQTQPQDQTVYETQTATFNIVPSGTAPLSYQWHYTNNIDTSTLLSWGTNSTLILANVQLTNAGGYWVVVTNVYGSATSSVAQLTVNIPVVPSITVQPQDQTGILPGASATFSVVATGTDPLTYQWYHNTTNLLTNATGLSLTITNIQPGDAGSYSVAVSNFAGGVISSNAFLTVNTSPTAPVFFLQPASQVVVTGSMVSFSALAAGTQPIGYQWNKNYTPILGATSATLNLTNVQIADDGTYTVIASNSVGSTTSGPGQLTVTIAIPPIASAYNLTGFGQAATGGGVIPETNSVYRKVTNSLDLANALLSAYQTAGSVKVIEITTNLDLGWNEIDPAVKGLPSTPFRVHTAPLLHPRLLVTGVSKIDIRPLSGLTIFSANGATIRHATFNLKSAGNIIVRNLKFDEMWEWDEATTGAYDNNNWDFIDISSGVSNIWVDHCTFTKAYDGVIDTQAGSTNMTISWCKFAGDDGATNPNSFVWQQINWLEAALPTGTNKMYNAIRTAGCSTTNIVTIIQGHDKTSIAGGGTDPANLTMSMTYHHDWFNNCWDRVVPRLRGGNVHDYNIYVDDTLLQAAKNLRSQFTISSAYSFNPPMNGAISTEGGAILVEKSVYIDCQYPLRNNQTDPSDAFYTGKIKAIDTIYQMNSTVIRGDSTDPGNPMGPSQATIIPFSWNWGGDQLPYTYTPDDPAQLQAIITSPTGGAGSGVLNWDKTNWLMTVYGDTAPTIVADPQSQSYTAGQSATFTVAAGGSAPLSYQWYFNNTNTPIANATNTSLTLANLQTTNAGTYSVIVSNLAGSATSASAVLTVANSSPTLSPVPDTNIIAGVTLNITNVATDPDLPPQTLTFTLLSAPGNANLDAASGVFSWRPLISQAGTTNLITEKVADNGTPILSATQSFHVIVSAPVQPQTPAVTFSNGQFGLTITGDIGPDYIVLASTNLTDWAGIFTNPMPFTWTDPGTSNFNERFYRIQLGP
ncbi:MAG: immunoglobulin domain-containing protein [Verrucomicrobiota bacterium]|jgi:pectate lyase